MDGVPLAPTPKKRKKHDFNPKSCIICETNVKGQSVYGAENGRSNLTEASSKNKSDGLFLKLQNEQEPVYHMDCYKKYCLTAKRIKYTNCVSEAREIETSEGNGKEKRRHGSRQLSDCNVCIVCNAKKYKGDTKLFRICEKDRAQKFLLATKYFQDEVFGRTSTLSDENSIFAADIQYHNQCMSSYLLKHSRKVENFELTMKDSKVILAFQKLIQQLDFNLKGYELSELCLFMNSECQPDITITNKQVKTLLIKHYGEEIMFTYPKERCKSQLVFSSSTNVTNTVDKIWTTDVMKECAEEIQKEIENYDFKLDNVICDTEEIEKSCKHFQENRPQLFDSFFRSIVGSELTEDMQRQRDTIYQVLFYVYHEGRKRTPFHVCTAQAIHETSKSKTLITSFNHNGLSISYESLQRLNYALAARTIALAGNYRVPLSPNIAKHLPLRASMDNFDHEECTSSGIGGSHDTVLVFFQDDVQQPKTLPSAEISVDNRQKKLKDILPCQHLISFMKPKVRGEIDPKLTLPDTPDLRTITTAAMKKDFVWFLARFLTEGNFPKQGFPESMTVPSWSSFNSLITQVKLPKTIYGCAPILPYPATNSASIYTTMVNFQDAMVQVQQDCGSLWSDEGVYRIAKEIQLWFPCTFKNIFLGLGSFHTSKIIISCLGQYLEESGIKEALIECEIFGPKVVESMLKGNHYSRGVRGMTIVAEALQRLLLRQFFLVDQSKHRDLFDQIKLLQESCSTKDGEKAGIQMEIVLHQMEDFFADFDAFVMAGEEKSVIFTYWNTFISKMYPILRDIIRADKEGNWMLHVSAFRRALPLFFAFGKVNYARWGSVYFEDCLHLEEKHPSLFEAFMKGGFVVQHGDRKFSSIGMDQALEQCYNKPAKGSGGIIGMTRRKEAVALQDIIKHDTYSINMLYRKLSGVTENNEYDLHHEYSKNITEKDNRCVEKLVDFISERMNPFCSTEGQLFNIATGQVVRKETESLKLTYFQEGEAGYIKFRNEVFVQKCKKLLDPLSLKRTLMCKEEKNAVDINKETHDALRKLEIARERGYSIDKLLTFELTSTSLFLTMDGMLQKSRKSELMREIEKETGQEHLNDTEKHPNACCIVFDFMLHAHIIAAAVRSQMQTFGEFAETILKRFISLSKNAERVDIIFDTYNTASIKYGERQRRMKKNPIDIVITNELTPLPKDMDAFWASNNNKHRFQTFCRSFFIEKRPLFPCKVIYLSGYSNEEALKLEQDQQVSEVIELRSSLEEADERLFLHISHAIKNSHTSSLLVASSDTDVFVCALYYFMTIFKTNGLQELWIFCGKGHTSRYIPVHKICNVLQKSIVETLPAVHALSGCDTTSKVGSKHSAFALAKDYSYLLKDFGKQELTESISEQAEEFLTRTLAKNFKIMNDLRITKYHSMKNLDFRKLPPTSSSLRLHIKRAYLQSYKWFHILGDDRDSLDPSIYGYQENVMGWTPQITTHVLPEDFPHPCSCKKCAKKSICKCCINLLPCSRFCTCGNSSECRNISV